MRRRGGIPAYDIIDQCLYTQAVILPKRVASTFVNLLLDATGLLYLMYTIYHNAAKPRGTRALEQGRGISQGSHGQVCPHLPAFSSVKTELTIMQDMTPLTTGLMVCLSLEV
jgi:hypothetical protein